MIIQPLVDSFTICKVADISAVDITMPFCFVARTDEECSVVCRTADVPNVVMERSDGWRGFRIVGELDFALTGILARIAVILAEEAIAIFAVSTFRTDYIFVKAEKYRKALDALAKNGYIIQEW